MRANTREGCGVLKGSIMAFDVSKFLALTVLIAGTGAACSGDDQPDPDNGGGNPAAGSPDKGDAGSPSKGDGGAGNGKAGEGSLGGEGGEVAAGGYATGGSAEGGSGQGGSGGDGSTDTCISNAELMGEGGAGGASALDVDPSLEGLCMGFFQLECPGAEGEYAPAYDVCEGVKLHGLTAVAVRVADCLTALGETGQCDVAQASACFGDLVGKACENPDSTAACEVINTTCTGEPVSVAACKQVANLVNADMYDDLKGCMDPAEEGVFDELFEGNCSERLTACASRPFY
jgi:hypothetical protein